MNTTRHNEIAFAIIVCSILFLLLAVLVFLLAYRYQKRKQNHIKEIVLLENTYNQTLLQTQIEIQEQTLKTISQEIHDNIGQQLSVSKFTLNTIETTDNKLLNEQIATCKIIISKAIQDLRDLSKSINNDAIEQQGLVAALQHELDIINKLGICTTLEVVGVAININPQIALILFRIIQESLNNAIKHAKANNFKVSLTFGADTLDIIVKDDGIGFDASSINTNEKGIGLINIKNRCKVIDANFNIESQVGKGTQAFINVRFTM